MAAAASASAASAATAPPLDPHQVRETRSYSRAYSSSSVTSTRTTTSVDRDLTSGASTPGSAASTPGPGDAYAGSLNRRSYYSTSVDHISSLPRRSNRYILMDFLSLLLDLSSVFIGTLECTNTVWKRCYLNFSCLDFLKGNRPHLLKGKNPKN